MEPLLFSRQTWALELVTPELGREASSLRRYQGATLLRCRYNECEKPLLEGQEIVVVRLKKSGKLEHCFCSISCQRRCWVDKRVGRD